MNNFSILVKETHNDMDLGKKVRDLILKSTKNWIGTISIIYLIPNDIDLGIIIRKIHG